MSFEQLHQFREALVPQIRLWDIFEAVQAVEQATSAVVQDTAPQPQYQSDTPQPATTTIQELQAVSPEAERIIAARQEVQQQFQDWPHAA